MPEQKPPNDRHFAIVQLHRLTTHNELVSNRVTTDLTDLLQGLQFNHRGKDAREVQLSEHEEQQLRVTIKTDIESLQGLVVQLSEFAATLVY